MVKRTFPLSAQNFTLQGTKDGQQKIKKRLTLQLRIVLWTILVLSVLVVVVVCVCLFAREQQRSWFPEGDSNSKLGVFRRAAVSTDAALCAPIGKAVLERNGSAVDSAVAMLLCMGVLNPQSQGLGGGFLMTVYQRETGKVYSINAREMAPLAATERMFHGNATQTKIGGLAIAVPGELAGYAVAHAQFGRLPWQELFQPAIQLCREGFPVTSHLAKQLKKYSKFIYERELFRRYFVNNETGELLDVGDTLYRPDLALTLDTIARDGAAALYDPKHPLAMQFHKDLENMGSIITPVDFEEYEAIISEPVSSTLRDNMTVHSSPIPGSGVLLAFMLNVLDGYNITSEVAKTRESAALTLHRIIEVFKFAYAKRMYLEDDISTTEQLIQNLTSREFAREIRSQIDDAKTFKEPSHYGLDEGMFSEDHGTSHASIVAPNGDAVSVTSTINIYFGSLEMSESTGIILNNEMDDFSNPNIVSFFGVPSSVRNTIKPKRRPLSSMCPTLVIDGEQNIRLTIGANGGTKIITGVLEVLMRNLWMDETIKRAIDAPRFHHQLLPDVLQYEKDFPAEMLKALESRGHSPQKPAEGMLSIVMGIARGRDGLLYANSDHRKGGEVEGF